MASKNKSIGRKAERKFVLKIAERLGLIPLTKSKTGTNLPEAEIARAEEVNQHLDNRGIDIWFRPDVSISNLEIQVKSTLCTDKKTKKIDVLPLLEIQGDGIKVLITEMKHRPGKSNMMHLADVVTLTLDDFLELLSVYQAYKNDNDGNDSVL